MAAPIVRTFLIDTTQAEQSLKSLNAVSAATQVTIDALYAELLKLDTALSGVAPDSAQFTELSASIAQVESSINTIETGKLQEVVTDLQGIGSAANKIDTANIEKLEGAIGSVDASNVEQLNQSLSNIDTANAVTDIDNINNALSSINASTALTQVESVNAALDAVDTGDITGQIQNINTEFNNIDATNVTADLDEISTAIGGIDASNAVSEIGSIDGALSGIDTSEVVSEINNIGDAVTDINTNNITNVGSAVKSVVAPVNQLTTATDQLNAELDDTKVDTSSIEQAGADFQELAVEQEQVTTSSKSLKLQLRELQVQLANTDPDSAKYVELAQAASVLKDKIQDAAEAVGTQAGSAFERVGSSLGLVTGRIANLDFEGAAEGAKLLAKNIGDIKPGDITKGIQGIGSALGSVGKALLTNPIFLIGAAIAAAVIFSKELLSLIDGVTDQEQKSLELQKEKTAQAKQQFDAIGAQEESLKRQGLTEEQILKLKLDALDAAILEAKITANTTAAQAQGQIDAAKRNAEYLKTFLDFVTLPTKKLAEFFQFFVNGSIDVLNKLGLGIEKIDIVSKFDDVNNFIVKKIFDPVQVQKDTAAATAAALKEVTALENQRDGLLNARDAKNKAASDKAAADAKTAAEKIAADEKTAADKAAADQLKAEEEVSALLNQLYEENVKEFEDAEKKKTAAAELEADKRKKAEEDYNTAITALRSEQDAANLRADQLETIAIDNKYLDLREKAIQAGKSTVEIDAAYKAALEAQERRSQNNILVIKKESVDKGLQFAQGAIAVLQAFSDANTKNGDRDAKKKFKTDKALAIGAATVQTAAAVTGALTAGGNPIKLATGAQFVEAAVAGALGLAQIVKIKNSQFGGGATGGNDTTTTIPSTSDSNTASQPAQFNPLAASFLEDRPEQLTPRAYVLAGDVASQQEVRTKVEDLARIG